MQITRRKFVATTALAGAALPFSGPLFDARAAEGYVRPNVYSERGMAMLRLYERAIGVMKTRREGDPTSFDFQWYTHWVPGVESDDVTKNEKIAQLPPALRPAAQAMWNTCQGHGPDRNKTVFYFLPWHRMQLYYFEEIVRAACGDPRFTMPYWNYLESQEQGVLPAPFRNPNGPLYNPDRRPAGHPDKAVNDGAWVPNATVNYDCLKLPDYYLTDDVPPNFSTSINNNPHGIMHDQIGDEFVKNRLRQGMSFIPTAAGDPIFFLHHCNIDRLWASWNELGGHDNPDHDPNWADKEFTFADARGQTTLQKVGHYSSIKDLGYSYERLQPIPGGLVAARAPAPRRKPVTIATVSALALGAGATERPLAAAALRSAGAPGTRTYLVIKGLKVNGQPGTHYDIYLGAPKGAKGAALKPYYVGTPSFFDAVGMPGMGVDFTFEVTDIVARLKGKAVNLSFVASGGAPLPGSNPTIDKVELVSQ